MPSRKEGAMVTYSDLFQFGILIVAIIGLIYKIAKK
ncbi:putative holin-like toxin [Oribacterium sp. NK2B42]|nr:putative holin-like toxin [Oribacterium sp. NK2B42]